MPTPRPAGGRQTILQRTDIVGVEVHGFVVAGILGRDLGAEALGLVLGIVQLREAVGQFLAHR